MVRVVFARGDFHDHFAALIYLFCHLLLALGTGDGQRRRDIHSVNPASVHLQAHAGHSLSMRAKTREVLRHEVFESAPA
jgi:hypothetical protein